MFCRSGPRGPRSGSSGEEIVSKPKFGRCGSGSFGFSVAIPSRLVVFAFPAYGMWRVLGIDDLGSVGLGFTKMRL